MKLMIPLLLACMFICGCRKAPIESSSLVSEGKLISVEFLGQPYPEYSPHSLGWNTYSGGRVKIYENFIIITAKDGTSRLALHNWYKNLRYKL